jgi:hypothetical protein
MNVISSDKSKLDDETANTFLSSLVIVPADVLKAEAKERAEKDEAAGQENLKKLGAKWTADIKEMTPPDAPIVGMVRGKEFKLDSVELQGSRLVFRQGKEFFADIEVAIVLFTKPNESLEGKSFSIPKSRSNPANSPHTSVAVMNPGAKVPKTDSFINDYSLVLNFKTKNDKGEIPGAIYFCAPDTGKSFIAGTFVVKVK